jgi:hypothetical protein
MNCYTELDFSFSFCRFCLCVALLLCCVISYLFLTIHLSHELHNIISHFIEFFNETFQHCISSFFWHFKSYFHILKRYIKIFHNNFLISFWKKSIDFLMFRNLFLMLRLNVRMVSNF